MCGVFGIASREDRVIFEIIDGLKAQNNRGEQASGAAVFDGKKINSYRGEGLVSEVFCKRNKKLWTHLTAVNNSIAN